MASFYQCPTMKQGYYKMDRFTTISAINHSTNFYSTTKITSRKVSTMLNCRKLFSQIREAITRKYEDFRARRTATAMEPFVILVRDVKELVGFFEGDPTAGQIVCPTTGKPLLVCQRPISSLKSYYSDTESAGHSSSAVSVTEPDDSQGTLESSTDSEVENFGAPPFGHFRPCPNCNYYARTLTDLNRHFMAEHHVTPTEYPCAYCPEKFPFRFYLISHWKAKHSELPRPLLEKGSAQ